MPDVNYTAADFYVKTVVYRYIISSARVSFIDASNEWDKKQDAQWLSTAL